jgi:hypothetical protein
MNTKSRIKNIVPNGMVTDHNHWSHVYAAWIVKTIREEIPYENAKLISRSAHGSIQYAFVSDRFKKLRDGQVTISGTIREWERGQELPHQCVFCGSSAFRRW